ncbi:hypothetical protein [Rhodohalobacter sp. 8-1]|uniref:hypothetical protein n=1 Tax=Rhodohalobacter sp. 8-1 TaxID=3131972 RepID=UPI0030ECF29F
MGEKSSGIGLQYQYTSFMGQPASALTVGFSIDKNMDVAFSGTSTTVEETRDYNEFKAASGSVLLTFFPAKEQDENQLFTGEVMTGFGITKIHNTHGIMLMLGTGVSKGLFQNEQGSNIRPRISAGYTLSTIKTESYSGPYSPTASERTQVDVGVIIGAELLMDLRLSKTVTLLISPSLNFYPNERETGLGFSSSIVF